MNPIVVKVSYSLRNHIVFCILLVINLLLVSCGEKHEHVHQQTEPKKLDSFYLTNGNGDTIPTGQFFKLSDKPLLFQGSNKYVGAKGLPLYSNVDTVKSSSNNLRLIGQKKLSLDKCNYVYTYDDSIGLPSIVLTKGVISKVQEPELIQFQFPVMSQTVTEDIQILNADQGLPSKNITAILSTRDGFVWIGTDEGLVRYDGSSGKIYTEYAGLPERHITSLFLDSRKNLWIGFAHGSVVKYDRSSFTLYNDQNAGLGVNSVVQIKEDSESNIWVVSNGHGLSKITKDGVLTFTGQHGFQDQNSATGLFIDAEDRKWVTHYGKGGITVFDTVGAFRVVGRYGNWSEWPNGIVGKNDGDLYLGGWQGTFQIYRDTLSVKYDLGDVGMKSTLSEIVLGKENIYFTTPGGGFLILKQDSSVERITVDEGLSKNAVTCLAEDENGIVWIGTEGGGLCRYNPNSLNFITKTEQFNANLVFEVVELEPNHFLFATDNGIIEQDDDLITHYWQCGPIKKGAGKRNLPIHGHSYDVVKDHQGSIWTGFINNGVYNILSDRVIRWGGNVKGIGIHNPTAIALKSDGQRYCAGQINHLLIFSDTSASVLGAQQGLFLRRYSDLLFDKDDRLWLATSGFGMAMLVADSVIYYSTNEGLPSNYIHHLYLDRDERLWVCTDDGLAYFENGGFKTVLWNNSELEKAGYRSMVQDKNGDYWIGTKKGLIQLVRLTETGGEWSLDNYSINHIDKQDGLVNLTFLSNSAMITSDNKLMMGTEGGLMIRDLNGKGVSSDSLECYLETILINEHFVDFRYADADYLKEHELEGMELGECVPGYNYPSTATFQHNQNFLIFQFGSKYNGSTEKRAYSFYLEGLEDEWSKPQSTLKATYRNLPYGNFTFHLKVTDEKGNSSEEFVYPFSILPPWYHTWWARFLYIIIGLFLIYLVFRWRTARLRARQLELESEVEKATVEIKEQKNEIEKAHHELAESHQEIQDSIAYAKRIQSAILPPQKLVKEYLNESFILYKPKDVVAGDFYWMGHADGKVLFAAADCTGHGVPGAMVSVICNGGLNRSVNEFGLTDPGQILDKTRELVIKEFEKSEEEVKDGMDIALCSLTSEGLQPLAENGSVKIEYAGAHNALWIIRNGADEVEEIKADKQPIGKYAEEKPFTTKTVELYKGDSIYIFSDGYADQFGGEKGKKFKAANFKRLLLSIQNETMERQRELLDEAIEKWRGSLEQVDDICVIGVRI